MNRLLLLRRVYSTFLLSMFCVLAFAQGKQITGVIKDGTGEPMIGVNVLVKGTTNGTITDFDGKFAISDVKNSDVLTITYVGYVQQSIPVGNQTTFNIILLKFPTPIKRVGSNSNSNFLRKLEVLNQLIYNEK